MKRPPEPPRLTDHDVYLFREGTHRRLHEKLGAHPGAGGTSFAVWAPNAERVSVVGDWNGWDEGVDPLAPRGDTGIWEGFVKGVGKGALYKFHVASRYAGYAAKKADPFAIRTEMPPATGSVVWDLDYAWGDESWMTHRAQRNARTAPISIYEVHLGSWRRGPGNRMLTYREIAPLLAEHAKRMGFTHVELLPVMEHPFYGSWGYQVSGYFAPTSRYGTPQDLMFLVDHLHQEGLGVILDWVPSHFPTDEFALGYFDGTHLFEHADPRQGFHPDWASLIWNYGRHETRAFLLSSAHFWLDAYHADGLRVDAVASMLYLDYSRKEGEWIPNAYGGRENLDAIAFLRAMNESVFGDHPDIQTIAEESTAWPMVSRPVYLGGLGFGMKWDMGWMNDTLAYFREDPIHRKYHHGKLTFRGLYAFTENYVLPLSHDEVVHGKGSLLGKMPGDPWRRFANLRLLHAWMHAQPGKKLLFMGGEFGQEREWNHDESIDWHLLETESHEGVRRFVADLNRAYRETPALHERDFEPAGFEWIDCNDADQGVVSLLRKGKGKGGGKGKGKETGEADDVVLIVLNFTPVPRHNYRVGVPTGGAWEEFLNSDAKDYGGSGQGNLGEVPTNPVPAHGRRVSLNLTAPPLAAVFLRPVATK
jgi:1,4-alpha-glucan branching enzyme